jgi:hypothetical protein
MAHVLEGKSIGLDPKRVAKGEHMCFKYVSSKELLVHSSETWNVSHCGLALYIKKYLKAKEVPKFKYFTMQKYHLQKTLLKENQNPSRYHNSITNLQFQHKPKYHLSKILI